MPACLSAAYAAMDVGIEKWIVRDALEGFLDTVQEVVAQAATTLLTEGVAARKIAFRLWPDEQLASHLRRR